MKLLAVKKMTNADVLLTFSTMPLTHAKPEAVEVEGFGHTALVVGRDVWSTAQQVGSQAISTSIGYTLRNNISKDSAEETERNEIDAVIEAIIYEPTSSIVISPISRSESSMVDIYLEPFPLRLDPFDGPDRRLRRARQATALAGAWARALVEF